MITHNRLREIFFLSLIVILAATLRLYKLGDWSLWIDESFTIHDALNNSFGTKPINYLFVKFFLLIFGVSEWAARIGPAMAGILSIVAAYYFFKRVFDQNTALLGSLFLAFSSWHIYWSQNSRHYSLLLLFAILSLWCFYTAFENDSPLLTILSLIFFAFGVLTHPSIIFLMPALIGYLVLVYLLKYEGGDGYNLRNLLLFLVPVGIVGLSSGPMYKKHFETFAAMSGSGDPLHVLKTTAYYIQIPFLILTSVAVIYLLMQRDRRGTFLGMAGFIPLTILIIVSLFARASSEYIYYTLPVYCLTSAYFMVHIVKGPGGKVNIPAIGISVTMILIQFSHNYFYFTYQHGDRPRWKEAAEYVIQHKRESDTIISPAASIIEFYIIKSNKRTNDFKIDLRKTSNVFWLKNDFFQKYSSSKSSIWVIYNDDLLEESIIGRFTSWVEESAKIQKQYPAWTAGKNRTVKVYLKN
jgi:4-amino-4-deoxy-L-arabinose transferase-like glycosyltransferase